MRSQTSAPFLLLLPILLILICTILGPEIWAFFLSFMEYSPGFSPEYIGLQNYRKILNDPKFLNAVINNLIFIVTVITFEFLVGLGSALLIDRDIPLKGVWFSLLVAPYAISPVVACVIWKFLLDPSYGAVNYLLSSVGIAPIAWFGSKITSFIPIMLVDVWKFSPFLMIIAYAALTAMPQQVLEAARIDGANRVQTFFLVKLPIIRPALMVGLVFRIIFALREFGIVWLLTKGGPARETEILSVYLYKQSFSYFYFGKGAAVSVFMVILTFMLAFGIIKDIYKRMF